MQCPVILRNAGLPGDTAECRVAGGYCGMSRDTAEYREIVRHAGLPGDTAERRVAGGYCGMPGCRGILRNAGLPGYRNLSTTDNSNLLKVN